VVNHSASVTIILVSVYPTLSFYSDTYRSTHDSFFKLVIPKVLQRDIHSVMESFFLNVSVKQFGKWSKYR